MKPTLYDYYDAALKAAKDHTPFGALDAAQMEAVLRCAAREARMPLEEARAEMAKRAVAEVA